MAVKLRLKKMSSATTVEEAGGGMGKPSDTRRFCNIDEYVVILCGIACSNFRCILAEFSSETA